MGLHTFIGQYQGQIHEAQLRYYKSRSRQIVVVKSY